MLFAGESAQSDYIAQRRQYLNQSSKITYSDSSACQLCTFYIVTLLIVPIMLLASIIVLAAEWYSWLASTYSPCENSLNSLIGYAVCYGVIGIWLVGYLIINTKSCRARLQRTGSCSDYFSDVYTIVGVIAIYAFIIYNFVGTYWATENDFMALCQDQSDAVYSMLIANIVVTHIVFDIIGLALIPMLVTKYQWT